MANSLRWGHNYSDVHIEGGQNHLGDVHNYGETTFQRRLSAILKSLWYEGMTDRNEAIKSPQERTFDWTFLEGNNEFVTVRRIPRTDEERSTADVMDCTNFIDMTFKAWLQKEDQGVFCFAGKPGSGKSTFMKSLSGNEEANAILQAWAADKRLIRAEHFFWILGGPTQKSLEGLLRALLHQTLAAMSGDSETMKIIEHACGSRINSNCQHAWNRKELKDTLSRIVSLSNVRCFFLIDALDECVPQDRLEELADEVLSISRLPNVKVCVSCRPWTQFTQRFEKSTTLQLDQLTYRDMEMYVTARLLQAEATYDMHTELRERSPFAMQFIYDFVSAAQGVFLWIELVTNAICSEMRKGRKIEQLRQIISEFPSDLESYFTNFILNRISKTHRNVKDTAAALYLAMRIRQYHDDHYKEIVPNNESFLSFWLLSDGRLDAGFSWAKQEDRMYSSQDFRQMERQTAAFLRETCGDLLVLEHKWPWGMQVQFLHRSVFDFLNENDISIDLQQRAPCHFSKAGFMVDLTKLRLIYEWRNQDRGCETVQRDIYNMLRFCRSMTSQQVRKTWLSTCEDLAITHIREYCNCYGLWHRILPEFVRDHGLIELGLHKFLLEVIDCTPWEAISDIDGPGLLGTCLLAPITMGFRDPDMCSLDMRLLRRVLECGHELNASTRDWLRFYPYRFHTGTGPSLDWCERTYWEVWLSDTYHQLQLYRKATKDPHCTTESLAVAHQFKSRNGSVYELLLQHGADPHCMPCITDHTTTPCKGESTCFRISLHEVLDVIVLEESLDKLQRLTISHADALYCYQSRRQQRLRAVRTLVVSQRLVNSRLSRAEVPEDQVKDLGSRLHEMLSRCLKTLSAQPRMYTCRRCLKPDASGDGLAAWCVDCGSLVRRCIYCIDEPFDCDLASELPCKRENNVVPTGNHTSILLGPCMENCMGHDCSLLHAFDILEEWYRKNSDTCFAIAETRPQVDETPLCPQHTMQSLIGSKSLYN